MFNILQMYKNNLLYQNIIKENYYFTKWHSLSKRIISFFIV